jgi:hypothetical protein
MFCIGIFPKSAHTRYMTRVEALKSQASELNDQERASLASHLLHSLPATLHDEDEGLSEARRRDREFSDSNASCSLSWEELKKSVGR